MQSQLKQVDQELYERVASYAKAEGKPVCWVIFEALSEYLQKHTVDEEKYNASVVG